MHISPQLRSLERSAYRYIHATGIQASETKWGSSGEPS